MRILTLLLFLFFFTGCAGVGVVSTSDPLAKLNDAEDLYVRQDRPLIAERLIREAMSTYRAREDQHGLGNSYREYGDLLASPSVSGKWQKYYQDNGFLDRSVTYENRMEKALEYYTKALEYYSLAISELQNGNHYDSLTNVYYNMAYSYYKLDDRLNACHFYGKTLEAYSENIKRNPTARPNSSVGTVVELVAAKKKLAGCE